MYSTAGQVQKVSLVQAGHRAEVEVGQFPEHGKPSRCDPPLVHTLLTLVHLLFGQGQQIPDVVLVGAGGIGRKWAVVFDEIRQVQLAQVRFQERVACHGLPPVR